MGAAHNSFFPFHALGFRCNPFRALTDEEWGAIVLLPAAVTDALSAGGRHLQIVGEAGCGKTSTLLALWKQFQDGGQRAAYEYLPAGTTVFRTDLRPLEVFLLDEAQRLNRRARRRLAAAAAEDSARIIVSSHRDLSPLFERAGASLTTVRLDFPSPARLRQMLHRRLAYFALHPDAPPSFRDDALDALRRASGGNLRAVERCLYEAFQTWAAAGSAPPVITAAALNPFTAADD